MNIKKQLALCEQYSDFGEYQYDDDRESYVFRPKYFSYGDYDGYGLVGKSNIDVFIEEFGDMPFVDTENGSYGHCSLVLLPLALRHTEILDCLKAVSQYPALDDDHHSHMEYETFMESWEEWGSDEFIEGINKAFDLNDNTFYFLEEVAKEKTLELFHSLDLNWLYQSEGMGVCINISGGVEKLTRSHLAKFFRACRKQEV